MRAARLVLLLASVLLLPALGAAASAHLPGGDDPLASWSPAPQVRADVACVVGDADHDGADDLLVSRLDRDSGARVLTLLAGPSYRRAIWSGERDLDARLSCGADAQLDGAADPILRTTRAGRDAAAVLDATTGRALFGTSDAAPSWRLDPLQGAASLGGAKGAFLAAAGPGLFVHATSDALDARVAAPGAELGVGAASLRVELLDARGERIATLDPPAPARAIIDVASATDAAGARVMLLSAPARGASQAASLSAWSSGGALLWSAALDASADAPRVLPDAGDVDGDGVHDVLVVGPSVRVLSGRDGSLLDERAPGVGERLAALPFGSISRGRDSFLLVRLQDGARMVTVDAVDGGAIAWSVGLPVAAAPVDALRDPYSSALTGFRDLTGDGVPDLALLIEPSRLMVVDGATGQPAWSAPVPPGARVEPVPGGAGGDDLVVVAPGPEPDLFALTRRDGATGEPEWSVVGPGDAGGVGVRPFPARADGAPSDLVVTRPPADGSGGGDRATGDGGAVYVVDGGTGKTAWRAPLDASAPAPPPLRWSGSPARAQGGGMLERPASGLPWWAVAGAAVTGLASLTVGALALRRMQ